MTKSAFKNALKKAWVWGVIAVTGLAGLLWGAWLWLWGITPAWAAPILVMIVFTVLATCVLWLLRFLLRLIEQWHATRNQFDTAKYREYGAQLLEDAERMREYVFDTYNIHDVTSTLPKEGQERLRQMGQARIDVVAVNRKFQAKYWPEVLFHFRLLKELGIQPPFHLSSGYGRAPNSLPDFLAHVGRLLSKGYLEEARKIDDEFGFRFIDAHLG